MKQSKTPLSINIIYWLTNLVFGLIILIGLAVLVFNVLVYTHFFGDDLQLHVQLPVKVNFLEKGTLYLNNTCVKVELVEASSKIHFFNTPLFIARKFGTAFLMAFGFIFYLFFTFWKFIGNVKKNRIFESSNIELLRNIAYGLFAFWGFCIVYSRVVYHFIASSLTIPNVEVLEDYRNFAGILMLALFTWVLSHIFLVGVKMKEEQDLTV